MREILGKIRREFSAVQTVWRRGRDSNSGCLLSARKLLILHSAQFARSAHFASLRYMAGTRKRVGTLEKCNSLCRSLRFLQVTNPDLVTRFGHSHRKPRSSKKPPPCALHVA